MMENSDETFVQVTAHRPNGAVGGDQKCSTLRSQKHNKATLPVLKTAYHDLEERLYNIFLTVHKLGSSASPWGVKKNAARANSAANDIKAQVPHIKDVFAISLLQAQQSATEIETLKSQLMERELRLASLKESASSNKKETDMFARERMVLKAQVEQLQQEKEELRKSGEMNVLHVAVERQMVVEKRVEPRPKENDVHTDFIQKLKTDIEARDAEIRKLQGELKRAKSDKGGFAHSPRESSFGRPTESKHMQRRLDAAEKAQQAMRIRLNEASSKLTTSQQETTSLTRKLSIAQKKQELLERELKTTKEQAAALRAEMLEASRQAFRSPRSGPASTKSAVFNAAFEAEGF